MARGALNTVALSFLVGLVTACAQTGAPGQGDQPGPGATGTRGEGRAAIASAYPPPKLTANAQVAIADATRAAKQATAAAVGKSVPVQATNMVTYTNPTLGLSFAYPAELGEVEFDIGPGETGYQWLLGFSRFDALAFDGRSVDFSEGRGGMDEDSYGYALDAAGTYLWRNPRPDSQSPIQPTEVIQSASGKIPLFELPQSGFQYPPDRNYVGPPAALVNLAGEQFPGFIAILSDPERLPMDTFRAILRTIRTPKPTEPVPTSTPTGWFPAAPGSFLRSGVRGTRC